MLTALDDAIESAVLGSLKVIEAELRRPDAPATTVAPPSVGGAQSPATS